MQVDFIASQTRIVPGVRVLFLDQLRELPPTRQVRWFWEFGDGETSASRNPAHTYSKPGFYSVSLTIELPGPTDDGAGTLAKTTKHDFIMVEEGQPASALDKYINTPPLEEDSSYEFHISGQDRDVFVEGAETGVSILWLELNSQKWRPADCRVVGTDVQVWRHYLTLILPNNVSSDACFLMTLGGSNANFPRPVEERKVGAGLIKIAAATRAVVAVLSPVPNQPLVFTEEIGVRTRVEDEAVAYSCVKYMDEHDASPATEENESWPIFFPMTKSIIRAMDAIQDLSRRKDDGGCPALPFLIKRFVIAGASKRGWISWLAGIDGRVSAIVPLVIEAPNWPMVMTHLFDCYGYWPEFWHVYERETLLTRLKTAAGRALMALIDPIKVKDRIRGIKYIVGASGCEIGTIDGCRCYANQYTGAAYFDCVPNVGHALADGGGLRSESLAWNDVGGFFHHIAHNVPLPRVTWNAATEETIEVETDRAPAEAWLWVAENPTTRDFRFATTGKCWRRTCVLSQSGDNRHITCQVARPTAGWLAFFVQLKFRHPDFAETAFTCTSPPQVVSAGPRYASFTGRRRDLRSGNSVVPVVTLFGAPERIGEQYGALMREEIRENVPAYLSAFEKRTSSACLERLETAWHTLAAAPETSVMATALAAELRAMARAAAIDYDVLRLANTAFVLEALPAQSVAYAESPASRSGARCRAIQWFCQEEGYVDKGVHRFPCISVRVPAQGGGFAHAIPSFAGFVVPFTGINLAGMTGSIIRKGDTPCAAHGMSNLVLWEILYQARDARHAMEKLRPVTEKVDDSILICDGQSHFKVVCVEQRNVRQTSFNLMGSSIWATSAPAADAEHDDNSDPQWLEKLKESLHDEIGAASFMKLCGKTTSKGRAILNLVYGTQAGLHLWISYANGALPASETQPVHLNLLEFLPC